MKFKCSACEKLSENEVNMNNCPKCGRANSMKSMENLKMEEPIAVMEDEAPKMEEPPKAKKKSKK